ncbi:hypothetical protein HYV50_03285 [Candidatus Pacearchaeota archaeon]|nr:hypothetical protein [Candidatus Pacearchaeota archaeon]
MGINLLAELARIFLIKLSNVSLIFSYNLHSDFQAMDNCIAYVTFICNCTDRELQKTGDISYAILCNFLRKGLSQNTLGVKKFP